MNMQSADLRPINIYTLGRFDIVLDGAPLRYVFKAPRKPLVLLKALLSGGKGGVSQEALREALWPELEQWSAVKALYATVLQLRKLLGRKSAVKVDPARVALDPEDCWVDAWAFENAVGQATDPTELLWALRFYRGMFLSDAEHSLASDARQRLRRTFIRAVLQLGQGYERIGDTQSAIDLYLMALDADSTSEDVHRGLMRCLAQEGQSSAVAAAFLRCRAMLIRHFGTEPSPLTEKIYRQACPASAGAGAGNLRAHELPPRVFRATAESASMR
ncbi:MAG TPA: bacterial transcriptional activator domain-containing protein [Steroidobacteraceae bacterium]|nr:bacterial transcriptional activator domain-containing protein [Steroidobacteraceae bacterium]